jgi:hypothetical protein
MLIPFLFLLQAALAGPAVRTDSEGLMGGGNTIEFTVLDVNERFAAVRHVYTINDEEERPEDCNYPGLGDHPTAGVQLALMELQTGKVTTFDVYETAHNGGHTDSPKPCTTTAEAKQRLAELVKKYSKSAGRLSNWLEKNLAEGFVVFNLPEEHRKKMRTSNAIERAVQQEIKRRTRKIRIFPNETSLERLVTAVLVEIDEKWITKKTPYINWEVTD